MEYKRDKLGRFMKGNTGGKRGRRIKNKKNIFERNKDKIINWYTKDKISGVEIQKKLKTKNKKIYGSLKEWDIAIRTKSEALKGRKQTEQEIINRIGGLKRSGKKWWKKASEISTKRFKNRKGKTYEDIYGEEKAKKIREKISGKNSRFYINGNGKGKYPIEFNDSLKKKIRRRDGNICMECGNFKTKLQIHHIDFNRNNNKKDNLITLCIPCHFKTLTYRPRNECINYFKQKMEVLNGYS